MKAQQGMIKEQKEVVQIQKKEIAELKTQLQSNKALEERLAKLEARLNEI